MMAGMTPRPMFLAVVLLAATLTACGGTASSPAATEAPEPSTVVRRGERGTAPADAPPSEASPTEEPPPADAGGPFADALVAALGAEELVTHIKQSASVTTSAAPDVPITATLEGDIAGQDLAMVIGLSAQGVDQVQELVIVGDSAYTRLDGGEWITAPRAAVADSLVGLLDNLRVVEDAGHLRYVGLEEFEGRQLHHLTAATDIPYTPSTGGTGQFRALDVWMEEDGTPVVIRGDFTAVDGAGNEGQGSSEMRFSNFGGPIEIKPPEDAP